MKGSIVRTLLINLTTEEFPSEIIPDGPQMMVGPLEEQPSILLMSTLLYKTRQMIMGIVRQPEFDEVTSILVYTNVSSATLAMCMMISTTFSNLGIDPDFWVHTEVRNYLIGIREFMVEATDIAQQVQEIKRERFVFPGLESVEIIKKGD